MGKICPYLEVSDLIVGETTCDGKKKMFEILGKHHAMHVMEIPNKKSPLARKLWLGEVKEFKEAIEKLTGNKITAKKLAQATRQVNERRRALKRLYKTRQANPVPISGKDALLVTQVSFYDDVDRATQQINTLCDELEARVRTGEGVFPENTPRILVSGSPMAIPNWKLHHILETSGAAVVCEESCTGTRLFDDLVLEAGNTVDEQLEAIADRYMKINCACFAPNGERLGDIVRLAREYSVDGVVHYNLQFCHTYATEAVLVEETLAKLNIPLLRIETDYSDEDTGQLRTRVDAFLEMMRK
jgi:benzoyl-CoA reductase/2-hydroxyglutaryl-CoA dehydratase subunit BcrC/BadD/HgdB